MPAARGKDSGRTPLRGAEPRRHLLSVTDARRETRPGEIATRVGAQPTSALNTSRARSVEKHDNVEPARSISGGRGSGAYLGSSVDSRTCQSALAGIASKPGGFSATLPQPRKRHTTRSPVPPSGVAQEQGIVVEREGPDGARLEPREGRFIASQREQGLIQPQESTHAARGRIRTSRGARQGTSPHPAGRGCVRPPQGPETPDRTGTRGVVLRGPDAPGRARGP